MRFDVITLFPEMVAGPFRLSLMGKAQERGRFLLQVHDLREYAEGRHRVCDDYPFGGGEGMVLKVEPLCRAVRAIARPELDRRVLLMSPGGTRFDQAQAVRLARYEQLVLLCGHYEGVDERVREHLIDEEISIGDFVLTGGELAAMVVIETTARLLPGVVGDEDSIRNESFEQGLLDFPQYTRPRSFEDMEVPAVLLSGDHARIASWRREQALRRTLVNRPDLLEHAPLTSQDRAVLARLREELAAVGTLAGKADGDHGECP